MSVMILIALVALSFWIGSAIGYLAATPYPNEFWQALIWLPETIAIIIVWTLFVVAQLIKLIAVHVFNGVRDRFR